MFDMKIIEIEGIKYTVRKILYHPYAVRDFGEPCCNLCDLKICTNENQYCMKGKYRPNIKTYFKKVREVTKKHVIINPNIEKLNKEINEFIETRNIADIKINYNGGFSAVIEYSIFEEVRKQNE